MKYEVDKKTAAMFVNRFMAAAMHYPTNYGYIPHTLSEDDDPVEVLVVTPMPLITGAIVQSRPVGMLRMEDESGIDSKILAVPIDRLTTLYQDVETFRNLPKELLDRIAYFFQHHKDLEAGKWVKIRGWVGPEEAKKEILSSVERYQNAEEKPGF